MSGWVFTTLLVAASRARDDVMLSTGRAPSLVCFELDALTFEGAVIGWCDRIRVCDDADRVAARALSSGTLKENTGRGFVLELRRAP